MQEIVLTDQIVKLLCLLSREANTLLLSKAHLILLSSKHTTSKLLSLSFEN